MYKRVLLKLSGEALGIKSSDNIIDVESLKAICERIKTLHDEGLEVAIVIGAGNIWRGKVAEKIGFSRVVLSRETKLEDIIEIKNNTNLEIEYFVQGALCIAFSGNCYMSSKEQGASGNRGLCKQLCRLPYISGFEKDNKF